VEERRKERGRARLSCKQQAEHTSLYGGGPRYQVNVKWIMKEKMRHW